MHGKAEYQSQGEQLYGTTDLNWPCNQYRARTTNSFTIRSIDLRKARCLITPTGTLRVVINGHTTSQINRTRVNYYTSTSTPYPNYRQNATFNLLSWSSHNVTKINKEGED